MTPPPAATPPAATPAAAERSDAGRSDAGRSATDAADAVSTPTAASRWRRGRFWVGFALLVVLLSLVLVLFTGAARGPGSALDATAPGPDGTRALVEVLRDEGVTVRVAETPAQAVDVAAGETVVLVDNGLLDVETVRQAVASGARVVLLEAGGFSNDAMAELAPDLAIVGGTDDQVVSAECGYAPATAAGSIVGEGVAIGGTGDTAELPAGWQGCFPQRDDGGELVGWSLAVGDDGRLVVLGATAALTNDRIPTEGNAALGLWLLGQDDRLTWFLPDLDDLGTATGEPSLAELTPTWVTPVLVLGVIAVLAAAFWRGRRMGALVVEDLPVEPRASETMEGRSRLYRAAAARSRTLDALRIRTIGELGARLGLGPNAAVDAVVDATATLLGRTAGDVRRVLVDATPANDRELVRCSDELLDLEAEVAGRVGAAPTRRARRTTDAPPATRTDASADDGRMRP